MKTESSNPKVIKRATCKSLSGKSTLTFAVAVDDDDELVFRVLGNDGGGFHSTEPVKISEIIEALESLDADEHFSSMTVGHLFHGQSANNRSFLMAVLREENIVKPVDGQQRKFQLGDIEAFLARAKQLQSGKAPRKKAPTKKKAPAKAKAAPTKKKAAPRAKKKPA